MGRLGVRSAGVSAMGLALLAGLAPGAAAAGPGPAVLVQSWAWANNRQPLFSHVPTAANRGNLLGGGAATITRNALGDYTVTFPGAAIAGQDGIAHVSVLGVATRVCVTTGTTTVGADIEIGVFCTGPGPVPFDSPFTVTYLALSGGAQPFGYMVADHPGPNPYTVATAKSYNSSGSANQVRILGVGQYRFRLKNLGTTDGDVQVTPLTDGRPRFCEVDSWGAVGADLVGELRCYKPNGVLADSRFMLSWNDGVGLKGDGGTQVAYVLADQAGAAAAYVPPAPTRYNSTAANVVVARVGVGEYKVTFKVQPSRGTAVVTPYGAAGNRCFIDAIRTTAGTPAWVRVGCLNGAGGRANTQFMVSWLR